MALKGSCSGRLWRWSLTLFVTTSNESGFRVLNNEPKVLEMVLLPGVLILQWERKRTEEGLCEQRMLGLEQL